MNNKQIPLEQRLPIKKVGNHLELLDELDVTNLTEEEENAVIKCFTHLIYDAATKYSIHYYWINFEDAVSYLFESLANYFIKCRDTGEPFKPTFAKNIIWWAINAVKNDTANDSYLEVFNEFLLDETQYDDIHYRDEYRQINKLLGREYAEIYRAVKGRNMEFNDFVDKRLEEKRRARLKFRYPVHQEYSEIVERPQLKNQPTKQDFVDYFQLNSIRHLNIFLEELVDFL